MEFSDQEKGQEPSTYNLSIVAITMTITALAAAMFLGSNVFLIAFFIILIALILGIIARRKSAVSWLTFLGVLIPFLGLLYWIAFLVLALAAISMFT